MKQHRVLAFVCVFHFLSATILVAGVTITSNDTPMVVPDGGAGVAVSTIPFPISDTVTGLELAIAITFGQPAASGVMVDLVGPNAVPPSGNLAYLLAGSGGDIYIRVSDDAPQACNNLCGSIGCGTPENPVLCSPFDPLAPFVGEDSETQWELHVGNGPPSAGTVLESWSITLNGGELDQVVFFDDFESGNTSAWSSVVH